MLLNCRTNVSARSYCQLLFFLFFNCFVAAVPWTVNKVVYKDRKNWVVTLAIWGDVTPGAILTKCGLWGGMVVCNIWWLSVKGCGCSERGKFAFSHWLHASPLQHWSHYRVTVWLSGGVDCGRRRRNVYDKKPQRYAKDNRTAHLTARSDKSVVK